MANPESFGIDQIKIPNIPNIYRQLVNCLPAVFCLNDKIREQKKREAEYQKIRSTHPESPKDLRTFTSVKNAYSATSEALKIGAPSFEVNENLTMEPLTMANAAQLHAFLSDPKNILRSGQNFFSSSLMSREDFLSKELEGVKNAKDMTSNGSARYFLINDNNGETVGYLNLHGIKGEGEEKEACVAIAIDHTCSGKGMGSELMGSLIAYAKSIDIKKLDYEVINYNEPSKKLAQRLGFLETDETAGSYGYPIEFLNMIFGFPEGTINESNYKRFEKFPNIEDLEAEVGGRKNPLGLRVLMRDKLANTELPEVQETGKIEGIPYRILPGGIIEIRLKDLEPSKTKGDIVYRINVEEYIEGIEEISQKLSI